jgi:hypothetical protein
MLGAVACTVAGCGPRGTTSVQAASTSHSGASSSAADASEPNAVPQTDAIVQADNTCGVYLTGSDVRLFVTGGDAECVQLSTDLSAGGQFWTVRAQPAGNKLDLVCAMVRGQFVVRVFDSGGHMYGQSACSSFLSSGWTEDANDEDAAAAAATQAAQASAAAAAAASQAAADAAATAAAVAQMQKDEASAQYLIDELKGAPGKLSNDLETVKAHLNTMATDTTKTLTAAKLGAGQDCSNAQDVNYDAVNVVGYDAENVIGYDAANVVGYDLSDIRGTLADLRTALALVESDGGNRPPQADAVINAVNAAISDAVVATNAAIDKANSDVVVAYSAADKISTGDCDGYGPGKATPVDHIS